MIIEKTCPLCNDTGKERHQYTRDDGESVTELVLCEVCNGKGHIVLKEQEGELSLLNKNWLIKDKYSPLEERDIFCDISDSY